MSRYDRLRGLALSIRKMSSYNLKIIFANKFIYFLLAAFLFFLAAATISFFSSDHNPDSAWVFGILLFPGILLIFYPTAFGIQNDADSRMLEILFGIPDYRYKVWLVRLAVQQLAVAVVVLALAFLCRLALADFAVGPMVLHVMAPVLFLGCLGFMAASLARNGNGAAAVLLMVGLVAWMMAPEVLQGSRWNLYLNPYDAAEAYESLAHDTAVFYNRVYLLAGSGLATLTALLRLQKRESFM